MKKDQGMNVSGNGDQLKSGINRREMVRRLVLAGGTGFVLSGVAEGRTVARQVAGGGATAIAEQKMAGSDWTPAFLDQHQSETLAVLAEKIIPGSSKAQVNRFIDLLLSVDTQEQQEKFVASLSAFEAESLRRFSNPYKDLAEIQQDEILTSASTSEPGHASDTQPQQLTLRDHFENIKSWVSGAYYSSEIGMKELGWTGQVYFTSFSGCRESGEPLT